MPRKTNVPKEELIQKLLNREIVVIDEDGRPYPKGDECYTNISKMFPNTISKDYAYIIITQNRFNVWSNAKLGDYNNFINNMSVKVNNNYSTENSSYINSDRSLLQINDNGILNLKFEISKLEWDNLKANVQYGNRKYNILKKFEWTNIMEAKFSAASNFELRCCLNFSNHRLSKNGENFTCNASCRACKSELLITLTDFLVDGSPVFVAEYEGGFADCMNEKKRKLRGQARNDYKQLMIEGKKSAALLHNTVMAQIPTGKEPASLPSSNALRCAKSEALMKTMPCPKDEIIGISMMMNEPPYSFIFKELGYIPFFLTYWSDTEIESYRLYSKLTKYPIITIDATGSLIKPIKTVNGIIKTHVYLYQIVFHHKDSKSILAISHMLSTSHNNNKIGYWLRSWLMNHKIQPKIIVCDQSLALIMAIISTFTQYSTLNEYLRVCSQLLQKRKVPLPIAQVRNDVNHIMHIFSGWKVFLNRPKKFKIFIMHILGLIVQSTSYESTKDLIKNFFIIVLSNTVGLTDSGDQCNGEKSLIYFKKIISGSPIEELNYDECNNSDNVFENDEIESVDLKLDYIKDIENILNNCKNLLSDEESGVHDNFFQCPEIIPIFLKFIKLLPLWSGVMTEIFGYGSPTQSTSSSENMFNVLKNQIFSDIALPVRLHTFLERHILSLQGGSHLSLNTLKSHHFNNDSNCNKEYDAGPISDNMYNNADSINVNDRINSDNDDDFFSLSSDNSSQYSNSDKNYDIQDFNNEHSNDASDINNEIIGNSDCNDVEEIENKRPAYVKKHTNTDIQLVNSIDLVDKLDDNVKTYEEIWVKKSIKPNRMKKSYLDPNPNIKYMEYNGNPQKTLGILRNGNMYPTRSTVINDKRIFFRNTCSFDCLFHLICCAVCDSDKLNELIALNEPTLKEIINKNLKSGINLSVYKLRSQILFVLYGYDNERYRSLEPRNKIFEIECHDYMTAILHYWFCSPGFNYECNNKECKKPCRRNDIIDYDYTHFKEISIQNFINNFRPYTCQSCNKMTDMSVTELFFIGVYTFDSNEGITDPIVCLLDIPSILKIFGKDMFLRGCIIFSGNKFQRKSKSNDGHFSTICYRNGTWELYDDLLLKPKVVKETLEVRVQYLLYSI